MDRLAAGIMIAIAALVMNGGLVRDVLAEQAGATIMAQTAIASATSPTPVVSGSRSGRVLSLLLTLEALRGAPGVLDRSKV